MIKGDSNSAQTDICTQLCVWCYILCSCCYKNCISVHSKSINSDQIFSKLSASYQHLGCSSVDNKDSFEMICGKYVLFMFGQIIR